MGSVLYMWASMKFLPKFPSKQAQMQVILDVKSMLCPPNCAVIFQEFYMNCQPVSFIIVNNYSSKVKWTLMNIYQDEVNVNIHKCSQCSTYSQCLRHYFFSAKFYAHLVLDRTSSGCTMSSKYLELWVTSFE